MLADGPRCTTCYRTHPDNHRPCIQCVRRPHDARPFLAWAIRNRHCPKIEIAARPQPMAGEVVHADHRWALARRLLHDTSLDPVDRFAGLLLLLYAQPAGRTVTLTTNRIVQRIADRQVQLLLGRSPIDLPPRLAELAVTLVVDRRPGRAALGRAGDHAWLFPAPTPPRTCPATTSTPASKPSGSIRRPRATPPCLTSPPSCPPPCSAPCSASASPPPPPGPTTPASARAMPPNRPDASAVTDAAGSAGRPRIPSSNHKTRIALGRAARRSPPSCRPLLISERCRVWVKPAGSWSLVQSLRSRWSRRSCSSVPPGPRSSWERPVSVQPWR